MDTTVITDTERLFAALRGLLDWSDSVDLCVAWASSSNGQGRHWKELDLAKVQRAVVGTAFAQTEPDALVELDKKADCLRLMINSTGTFHPKLILGRKGQNRRAIVGPANFTTAAYTSNTELSLLLEGTAHDPAVKEIESFIDIQWTRGVELDDQWLADYKLKWLDEVSSFFRVIQK